MGKKATRDYRGAKVAGQRPASGGLRPGSEPCKPSLQGEGLTGASGQAAPPVHENSGERRVAVAVRPELLAPVGQIESFFAAVENGADAVYLGLKRLSARATAANFSLDDLSLLVPYAHQRGVAVYVALNSLVTAPEFPGVMDLLQSVSDLQTDALIVQDAGLFFLARKFFPQVKLHASTLMTLHNHAGVNQLERMGAQRVVLARETSLAEIEQIASRSRVELEIFVHGALCYSYSGLCLASSFRGGHSGLQGRCVQPCRLSFKQGRKEGFFLSCSDLCALQLIPRLKQLRIAAFKIEGRMKSADSIAQVVKAYRHVMDAPPESVADALAQAQEWLSLVPSRRLTLGFFGESPSVDVLAPHRSGSSGLWVGTVKGHRGGRAVVDLRRDLRPGDRLRPESSEGREKDAFTVAGLYSEEGELLQTALAGHRALVETPGALTVGEKLFKTGMKTRSASSLWQKLRSSVPRGLPYAGSFPLRERVWEALPVAVSPHKSEETLIVKIGLAGDLAKAFQSPAQWVMLTATRSNLERVARQRLIPAQKNRLIWSLPALLSEKEIDTYRSALAWYCRNDFRTWEVNNWGHFDLFPPEKQPRFMAGWRFNVRNQAAMAALAQAGCNWTVLSLEITREELQHLSRGPLSTIPIVTVFAWPPLFTSRLIPRLLEDKPIFTPRKEAYFFRKSGGASLIYADQCMNWFEQLPILRGQGYRHFLLDLSDGPRDPARDFERVLSGFKRMRADKPFSLFNFERRPQ